MAEVRVYSNTEIWIIAILAALVGGAIGYFLHRYLHPAAPRRSGGVDHELHALQEQHKNYRYEVNSHFNRTAELLTERSEEHRLNSSHVKISYAVFCLKKKNRIHM